MKNYPVLLLALVVAISACVYGTDAPIGESGTGLYEDTENLRFSISLPAGYKAAKFADRATFTYSESGDTHGIAVTRVLQTGRDIYVRIYKDDLLKRYPGYKIIWEGESKLGEYNSYEIHETVTRNFGPEEHRTHFVFYGNSLYVVSFSVSPPARFAVYDAVFNASLATFRLV